ILLCLRIHRVGGGGVVLRRRGVVGGRGAALRGDGLGDRLPAGAPAVTGAGGQQKCGSEDGSGRQRCRGSHGQLSLGTGPWTLLGSVAFGVPGGRQSEMVTERPPERVDVTVSDPMGDRVYRAG